MIASYHIGEAGAHGARYALLPGDPDRVERIAAHLDAPVFLSRKREYTAYVGTLEGERVLVMSTGMGGPSTAIAVEELYATGVRTLVRIGTCGGMGADVVAGDVVIATGAIRMEGTTREYVPIEYPAVADHEVVGALAAAARARAFRHHVGIVQSKDSFYGQHDPDRMPAGEELSYKWRAWVKAGCLASEMEGAALFITAGILGARAGAVFSTVWNQERAKRGITDPECHDTERAITVAVDALRALIRQDRIAR